MGAHSNRQQYHITLGGAQFIMLEVFSVLQPRAVGAYTTLTPVVRLYDDGLSQSKTRR
jgi:hypothetical protein